MLNRQAKRNRPQLVESPAGAVISTYINLLMIAPSHYYTLLVDFTSFGFSTVAGATTPAGVWAGLTGR